MPARLTKSQIKSLFLKDADRLQQSFREKRDKANQLANVNPALNALISSAAAFVASGGNPAAAGVQAVSSLVGQPQEGPIEAGIRGIGTGLGVPQIVGEEKDVIKALETAVKPEKLAETATFLKGQLPGQEPTAPLEAVTKVSKIQEKREKAEEKEEKLTEKEKEKTAKKDIKKKEEKFESEVEAIQDRIDKKTSDIISEIEAEIASGEPYSGAPEATTTIISNLIVSRNNEIEKLRKKALAIAETGQKSEIRRRFRKILNDLKKEKRRLMKKLEDLE